MAPRPRPRRLRHPPPNRPSPSVEPGRTQRRPAELGRRTPHSYLFLGTVLVHPDITAYATSCTSSAVFRSIPSPLTNEGTQPHTLVPSIRKETSNETDSSFLHGRPHPHWDGYCGRGN